MIAYKINKVIALRVLFTLSVFLILLASSVSLAARIGKYETVEVAFDAPDTSVELVGFLSIPPPYKIKSGPPPLIILLHQRGESSESWKIFREELVMDGFAVFAMDLRGYGLSTFDLKRGRVRSPNTFIVGEQLKYPDDIAFLVRKTIEVHGSKFDTTRLAVIGADIGANAGLLYAKEEPAVKYVALVSPGLDYDGLRIVPVMMEWDDRPVLFTYADKDVYSKQTSELTADLIQNPPEIAIMESMFHGNRLVNSFMPLRTKLIEDLRKYLPVR